MNMYFSCSVSTAKKDAQVSVGFPHCKSIICAENSGCYTGAFIQRSSMEDQISRTNEDSWSKDLVEIRSMLQELVAISKPTPLEFQRFCGENPDLWISQAERYFGFYAIEENQKLSLASSYLDGEALTWYQWLFQNKQLADWEHFTAKVLIRFRKRLLESPEGRVANLWQWRNISNSHWPQNNDKLSEYPTKIYEHKVFDEMLNSNYSKVFNVAPLDTPIEMPDDDAIGPGRGEVQLFHESPQIDMSERYVTTTSLDCGSCHQQIECDIPTSELPLNEIIIDIKQGKYNKGVEHDEGTAIMDPPEWDPGVTSKDMALTGCTVNVEPLLLLGSTGAFCFITDANEMNQVWDPRQRWSHLLIFSADALVCASYYDVVGKIHREGIAQVFSSVIAGQTKKILRDHVAFQMVIVFDPGGCTFDVPILEDMNGVLAEISKAWNFSMANPFDGQNRQMSNTIAQAKRLKCDVKVRGLIVTLKWWLSKHNTYYATTYRTFVLFAILRDLYAHVHTKWLNAVELVLLVTLATVALTTREVITKGKSYFILVGEQSSVCKTKITTMLKHYVNCYVMFFLSLTILTRTFQHQHFLVLLKYAAMMVEFIQLKGGSLVSFCAEILEVGDCFLVRLQPHRQHSMRWQLGNSWEKRQCRLFEVLRSVLILPCKLEFFKEAQIYLLPWCNSRLKHCTNQLINQQPMLLQNLEDKVLDSGLSIVVNQTNYIRDHGPQVMNETDPINIIGLIKMLESFIWDPGPIIKGLNRFGS